MTDGTHEATVTVSAEGISVGLIDDTDTVIASDALSWAEIIADDADYEWRQFTDAVQPAIETTVATARPATKPFESIDEDDYQTLDEHDDSVE